MIFKPHVLLCSVAQCSAVFQPQQRGMATLKIVALRLKSVKNIQKITQSMKMVSAAKYTRAERDLRAAKPYGAGAQTFFEVIIYFILKDIKICTVFGSIDHNRYFPTS